MNKKNFRSSKSCGDKNPCRSIISVHPDLLATQKMVYDPCHFQCSPPQMDAEGAEYGAYTFELNGFAIKFRVAKITPTKIGQFVTLWKRAGKGTIQPYDISDPIDFFIVSTRKERYFGQFVFPKSVLREHGVLSIHGVGGKRAIRVYPPWDKTLSRQAQKTQAWQIKYFFEISADNLDLNYARALMLIAS